MAIGLVELAASSAAVWRVTHLLHAEDGPWDLLARVRQLAGTSVWGKMLDCFYCASVWVAAPFAVLVGTDWPARFLLWPALSGIAILLERVTLRPMPIAQWKEEESNELLWTKTSSL